jgi:regulator of protease activity HflC (stomatin/prohibitin superfamily)
MEKHLGKLVLTGILILTFLITLAFSCTQIETGSVGIARVWKEVQDQPLNPGIHFYNPFSTDVEKFDVKEQRFDIKTPSYTKDTQIAEITITINAAVSPNKAVELYSKVLHNWNEVILSPLVTSAAKDIVGQFIADELISKREVVREQVKKHIEATASGYGIIITAVNFTNIDFDDKYEKAVEDKVVAIQKAAEAKNKTVEISEQANQRIIQAKAEAEAIQIQTEALAKSKSLIEFEAVKRWNGVLPQYMIGGGSAPFIQIPAASK